MMRPRMKEASSRRLGHEVSAQASPQAFHPLSGEGLRGSCAGSHGHLDSKLRALALLALLALLAMLAALGRVCAVRQPLWPQSCQPCASRWSHGRNVPSACKTPLPAQQQVNRLLVKRMTVAQASKSAGLDVDRRWSGQSTGL